MGLEDIKKNLSLLSPKDAKLAEKYLNEEYYDDLLTLIEKAVEEANTDVQIASEEDNGQLMMEKAKTLDALMHLKYSIEDYIDDALEEYYGIDDEY